MLFSSLIYATCLVKGRRFNYSCYLNTEQGLLQVQQRLTPRKKELSRKSLTQVLGSESSTETLQLQTCYPQGEAPGFPLDANEASHSLV